MSLNLDPAKLREYVGRRGGGTDRYMNQKGSRVVDTAKQLVSGEMVNVQTGRLRSSIAHELTYTKAGNITLHVGSNVDYALMVHEGTSPHWIFPVHAKVLAFRGRSGSMVYTGSVYHPGTQPRRFLTEAMRRTT
jgi:hypothetical protein